MKVLLLQMKKYHRIVLQKLKSRKMLLLLFGLVYLVMLFTNLPAQEQSAAGTALADTIIVEGRYVMGDRDSKQDALQYALLDAKRKALEQIGTYIKSTSTVENFMLTEQEIKSYSAGFMKTEILEEREEPTGETRVVIVKIRVIVNPEEIRQEIQKMAENETYRKELGQLQTEYQQLWESMDSLRAADRSLPNNRRRSQKFSGIKPFSQRSTPSATLKELNRYDLLIQLIVESNRERPNLKRVRKLTETLLQKYPNMKFIYGYLGISYFKNGYPDQAIQFLQKALASKPGWRVKKFKRGVPQWVRERYQREQALFHFYLSRAFFKKNLLRQARRHLQIARELDPRNPHYKLKFHKIQK